MGDQRCFGNDNFHLGVPYSENGQNKRLTSEEVKRRWF